MRSRHRRLRPLHVAVGALLIATPASAVALSTSLAQAQSATSFKLDTTHVLPGHRVEVTGSTSASAAGQSVGLEFARAGSSSWQRLAAGTVASDGSFRFRASLWRTGVVRVASAASATGGQAADVAIAPSAARPVTVGSLLELRMVRAGILSGQPVTVSGTLLPRSAHRWIRLEGRSGGRWRVLSIAPTGSRGRFRLRYTARSIGQMALRVQFTGDHLNTASAHPAGALTVFRQAVASWYDDGGQTACGFHAYYGVASPSLPCGSRVSFRYGGATVTATVDDRGPYVGGRDYDLNQNTAGALGFSGVQGVWATR